MDIKKEVQKQFGRNAESYVKSDLHQKGKDLQMLVQIANISGNEEILDIATGGGHTANIFASYAKRVVALDLTSKMLQAAESFIKGNGHENVIFMQGDAEDLSMESDSFDIVTCRIAPHHFPNVEKFIEGVHRVLKKGGQFLLDDNVSPEDDKQDHFYNTIEKKRDNSHFRAWKKSEWIIMLERAGFAVKEMHRFEKMFNFDEWCNRMKLNDSKKKELSMLMLEASPEIKKKFQIKVMENNNLSFIGEAMIIKAIKE